MPASRLTDEEIRFVYGRSAVISRKGSFVLVHLDSPSETLVRQRTRSFRPDRFFTDDCPLCQMAKADGVVVYDERAEFCDQA